MTKNRLKGVFPENKDPLFPKEVIDVFFAKSSKTFYEKKKPYKPKKPSGLLASILLGALALSLIIIIINSIRQRVVRVEASSPDAITYSENIIRNGKIRRHNVEEIYFDADAKEGSSFLENDIKLVNTGKLGRAALVIRFRDTFDLSGKNLLIAARSGRGRKTLKLILKDSDNRLLDFRELRFTTSGETKHVLPEANSDFNLKKTKEFRFEFGTRTAGNDDNATIYLRDLTVRGAGQ